MTFAWKAQITWAWVCSLGCAEDDTRAGSTSYTLSAKTATQGVALDCRPSRTLRSHNNFDRHIVAHLLDARRMRQHGFGLPVEVYLRAGLQQPSWQWAVIAHAGLEPVSSCVYRPNSLGLVSRTRVRLATLHEARSPCCNSSGECSRMCFRGGERGLRGSPSIEGTGAAF